MWLRLALLAALTVSGDRAFAQALSPPVEAGRVGYWDGLWAGAFVGGGLLSARDSQRLGSQPDQAIMAGGVQAGYDFQFGSSVFGAIVSAQVSSDRRSRAQLQFGGRLGYLIASSTLIYAMGGITMGSNTYSSSFPFVIAGPFDFGTAWTAGYFVGAGVEARVSRHWSLGAEYSFSDHGSRSVSQLVMLGAPVLFTGSQSIRSQLIRMTVRYRF